MLWGRTVAEVAFFQTGGIVICFNINIKGDHLFEGSLKQKKHLLQK